MSCFFDLDNWPIFYHNLGRVANPGITLIAGKT